MSSFTGLFSSGGGGETHIKTDPRKLTRTAFAIANIKGQNRVDTIYSSNSTSFFIQSAASDHYAYHTSSDTYTTLLDVTNPNGGYLHWVISPGVANSNSTSYIKITVDGEAYEFLISYNVANNWSFKRMIIGGVYHVAQLEIASYNGQASSRSVTNPYEAYGASDQGHNGTLQFDDPSNNVYGYGNGQLYLPQDFALYNTYNGERLRFESTLKVETKMAVLNTADNKHYASCFYTLQ